MNMKLKTLAGLLAIAGIAAPGISFATNGMNLEGYGPIATGMGGASMAYDNGSAAMMNNPATIGLMPDGDQRFDLAVGMLGPDVKTSAGGANVQSGGDAYYMPAIGYVRKDGNISLGFGVFAQGGMGTEYAAGSLMSAGSGIKTRSEVGVGRAIIPFAFDVQDNLVIGGSVDYVWADMDLQMAMSGQQFGDMVAGLGGTQTYGTASGSMVTGLSQAIMGGAVTGVNWARFDFTDDNKYTGQAVGTGYAGKLGLVYKVNPKLSIGATYHSKTKLGDLEADQASISMSANVAAANPWGMPAGTYTLPISGKIAVKNFQWPETYGLGLAYQATDKLMVAADYKRIGWKNVMKDFKMTFTADNSASNQALGFANTTLDATMYQNWDDQDVFSFGVGYKRLDALPLRAGLNLANNPIPDKYENPLFPAIEKNHVTLGAGYMFNKVASVDFSYAHGMKVTVTNGQGVETSHSQDSWQMMYSHRF